MKAKTALLAKVEKITPYLAARYVGTDMIDSLEAGGKGDSLVMLSLAGVDPTAEAPAWDAATVQELSSSFNAQAPVMAAAGSSILGSLISGRATLEEAGQLTGHLIASLDDPVGKVGIGRIEIELELDAEGKPQSIHLGDVRIGTLTGGELVDLFLLHNSDAGSLLSDLESGQVAVDDAFLAANNASADGSLVSQ